MRRGAPGWFSACALTAALVVGCATGTQSQAAPNSPAPTTSTPLPASTARPAPIPPISSAAHAAGLVDVRTVIPDAVIDLRYATPNNFVGVALYPRGARCLVHQTMADGLRNAARTVRAGGERLVFWDCYRPHSVQVRMFQKVPDPAWVARPGPYSRSHEAGRSVDVTFAARVPGCPQPRRVGALCLADMGTGFDDFSPAATAFATAGVSSEAQRNRARLRSAMTNGGLAPYSGEWWHFDGAGAGVQRPIIDVPLT